MLCKGCQEQFSAKKLNNGYCENCIEGLNLKVCKECKKVFSTWAMKDGYCHDCRANLNKKEEKKHSIKGIVLLLIALGFIGAIAYTFGYLF
jgi:rRNA maturation endonuclease Nob1